MGLRPAKCYKKLEKPYTRKSRKKPRKGYVKGVPEPKIHRFEIGNAKKNFPTETALVANQSVQIRHNALESARVAANKALLKSLGKGNYFLKILIYPHHVLRENPIATGAGADRFQTGMKLSFGRPVGTAARVRAGQRLILVRTSPTKKDAAKKALKIAGSKLPTTCSIVR